MSTPTIDRIKSRHKAYADSDSVRVVTSKAGATTANRDILVPASTLTVDLEDEIVVPSGGRLGYFGKNRNVFVDHKYDVHDFVGSVRTGYPKLVDDVWMVKFGVSRSPLGDQILRDAEDFGCSVSIGLNAIDAGSPTPEEIKKYGNGKAFSSIVREWEWIELSVTYIPCNPDARGDYPKEYSPGEGEQTKKVSIKPDARKRLRVTPYGVVSM